MTFIRTMLGDIKPEDLGFTYSHEHIVCRPPYWVERNEDDLILDDPEKSENEIALLKEAGCDSVVDATAIDYGRDPAAVRDISKSTGMHIIGTAGFNKSFLWSAKISGKDETFNDWIERSSVDELTKFIISEVESGMNGTDVKAGQLKFGTGYNSITPLEIKTIRAVARAHFETGAPIHAHTEAGTMAHEQIKFLREEGVDLSHCSFGHMDRNPDPWVHRKIAETGAYLCFDGIGKIKYAPESTRIKCILELVRTGYQKQILASGDTARKSYYYSYTYSMGLPHIIKSYVPRLIEEADAAGIDGEQLIKDMFINNPREFLSFKRV